MVRAASLGLLVGVHCENETITRELTARARAAGRHAMHDWARARPIVAETEAIRRAIGLAEETGCALHVVHVSTGAGVALVTEARTRGVGVTCEVCPHHLILTEGDAERPGMIAKCAPPLRSSAETDALWRALVAGEIGMVASDHSPVPASAKSGDDVFAGAGLDKVEIHDEERGRYMTAGTCEYVLNYDRHRVEAGDFIYMAPYCPQGFTAGAEATAEHLLYKDVNRDGF